MGVSNEEYRISFNAQNDERYVDIIGYEVMFETNVVAKHYGSFYLISQKTQKMLSSVQKKERTKSNSNDLVVCLFDKNWGILHCIMYS